MYASQPRREREDMWFITNSGAWSKPQRRQFRAWHIMMIGGGGGAGTGANASGTAPRGGTGGTAGARMDFVIPDLFMPPSLDITIGAGGAGGPSQALTNTAGNNGSAGGATLLAYGGVTLATCPGGNPGNGGGTAGSGSVGAGVSGSSSWVAMGVWIANTSQQGTQPGGGSVSSHFPSGGAAAQALLDGAAQACSLANYLGAQIGWPAPTGVTAGPGACGFFVVPPIWAVTGGSGASGSQSRNNADRPGGDGSYGSGGGGGSSANDTFSTGKGGDGGPGLVVIQGW